MFSELDLICKYEFRRDRPLLVDVGAHHGSVSFRFAKKGWRIVAFEPEKKNRQAFEKNLAGFDNVTCMPKAVSDISGKSIPFYVSDQHFGIHSIKPFHHTHEFAYEVETVRLDEVLEDNKISLVTLLKIDVEGADFLALKSFDFSKFSPELIMIEFMDDRSQQNFGYTHHDVAAFMKGQGYTTFVSEWAPIKEYGREGMIVEPHTWIQCVPYPLAHEPAWGNLIFVPNEDKDKFLFTFEQYMKQLQKSKIYTEIRTKIKMIPGTQTLYKYLRLWLYNFS